MKKLFCLLALALALVLAAAAEGSVTTIDELNLDASVGSHANDDIDTASLEVSYRNQVTLNSVNTGSGRYDSSSYPRVNKVKDDLYLLTWMHGQFGAHVYYATSPDGINWSSPEVLVTKNGTSFTYTDGPLAGTEDSFVPVNPEACVLKNGDILLVYYIRPGKGYGKKEYMDLNGIYLVRGKVGSDNSITWGEHEQITYGQGWECHIWQRPDGRVEVYWSNVAPYVQIYEFDSEKRSTGTSIVYSDDNGYTWTPSIEDGKNNTYLYHRVYQEIIGYKVPYGLNADGTPKYTESVPYVGGQMPGVTAMYNGKTFLAMEVSTWKEDSRRFNDEGAYFLDNLRLSFAVSGEGGNWKGLELLEDGREVTNAHSQSYGTAPYVSSFVSGEIYLTYGKNNRPYARLVQPDGSRLSTNEFWAMPGVAANWGGSEVVGSHKVLTTYTNAKDEAAKSVCIYISYLNHRTNAKTLSVTVDGNGNEWKNNTDALFIGSESQAQITVQTAHDSSNVYFLVNRLDEYLTDGDTVTLNIGVGEKQYYRVEVSLNAITSVKYVDCGIEKEIAPRGTVKSTIFGTLNNPADKDEGAVYEISIPKDLVGLVGKDSFKSCPALENKDGEGVIYDTLNCVSAFSTETWPAVELD